MADQIINDSIMFTADGGIAVRYINKTGAASVKGNLVEAHTDDNSVSLTDQDAVDCIGVVYTAGVADGGLIWVVFSGNGYVLLDDNTAGTAGNWAECSEAGYCNATDNSPAAAPAHFREIGHCLESVAATGGGTHVLCLINIHFL